MSADIVTNLQVHIEDLPVYVLISELDSPIVVTSEESELNTLVITYDQDEQDIEDRFKEIEEFNSNTFDVMSKGFKQG
jgi:hypothetical protein